MKKDRSIRFSSRGRMLVLLSCVFMFITSLLKFLFSSLVSFLFLDCTVQYLDFFLFFTCFMASASSSLGIWLGVDFLFSILVSFDFV